MVVFNSKIHLGGVCNVLKPIILLCKVGKYPASVGAVVWENGSKHMNQRKIIIFSKYPMIL